MHICSEREQRKRMEVCSSFSFASPSSRLVFLFISMLFVGDDDCVVEVFFGNIRRRIIKSNTTKCAYAHTKHFGMHYTHPESTTEKQKKKKEKELRNQRKDCMGYEYFFLLLLHSPLFIHTHTLANSISALSFARPKSS